MLDAWNYLDIIITMLIYGAEIIRYYYVDEAKYLD